ncbi:MAG TPA: glycosyltransferase family 87 protein [Terriglobales bacterium]|nr:glycosyltransferase family 87 protein [Terriglobales bacterium]
MNPGFWLTAKRIRIHGLLLALCLWTVYAVDMSAPGPLDRNGLVKGTDFLHFYTLGNLALLGRGDLLYDMRAQAEQARQLLPQAPDRLYVPLYGPQVSLLFAPFARLPYGWALAAWLSANLVIFVFCCYALWRTCPELQAYRWTVLILAIAFPGFFHLVAWGQTSGLALLFFTLAYLALRRDQKLLAGLAIGSLVFKPQLGVAAAVVFLFAREWKLIGGALAAASVQLGAAWMHYGTEVMRTYGQALRHVRDVLPLLEPRLYQTHSLRSLWSLLLPWPQTSFAFYVVSALGVLALAARCWQSGTPLEVRYAALLLATVLVSPHLTVYDLVILALAFLLLGDWALAHRDSARPIPLLLYACYPSFLLGPLARMTHVQFSVVAMTALLWISWRISQPRAAPPPTIPARVST